MSRVLPPFPAPPSPDLLNHARTIVFRHGRASTSHAMLRPGVNLVVDAANEGVIGWRDAGRFRITAGPPAVSLSGFEPFWDLVIRSCQEDKRTLCILAADALLAEQLSLRYPVAAAYLGQEPYWITDDALNVFQHKASLRSQLNRARNKGVRIHEWTNICTNPSGWERQARLCLEAWLTDRRLPTLRYLVDPDLRAIPDGVRDDLRFHIAEQSGIVVGWIAATPIPAPAPAPGARLIEQIIRHPHAPNGTAEALVHASILAMRDAGVMRFTLGMSPFISRRNASTTQDHEIPTLPDFFTKGLTKAIHKFGDHFYPFRGLYAFKSKFEPNTWEPRYALVLGRRRFPVGAFLAGAGALTGRPWPWFLLNAGSRRMSQMWRSRR